MTVKRASRSKSPRAEREMLKAAVAEATPNFKIGDMVDLTWKQDGVKLKAVAVVISKAKRVK